MTIDRRGFLYAGGLATAAAGSSAIAAHAAPVASGRSVEELGVVPNLGRDQTAALQKAIDTISGGEHAVLLPGGSFQVGKLTLPSKCTLIGQPGMTVLTVEGVVTAGPKTASGVTILSGIAFKPLSGNAGALVDINSGIVRVSQCTISGAGRVGLKIVAASVSLQGLHIDGFAEAGASIDLSPAPEQFGLVASDCRFSDCGTGIAASMAPLSITQCHVLNCGVGIAATGSGVVAGNVVTKARNFGLKLGSGKGDGHILAQGNVLRGCRIGIGVSSSGDDIMASLNLITGAKDGSIRAFDGDKLVGPDLARQSAEAYLNLMVAGNVAR
jgi:hypothetical protein